MHITLSFRIHAVVRMTWGVAMLPCLTGCYLLQAAGGQMEVLSRRQPIEAVIDNPETSPQVRSRLELVVSAREFASQELGLPDNASYRQYADLGRRYVVWNVFATPRFSVEPRQWCFPIAGCVVYRGYFAERSAHRYARRLGRRGNDVAVAGVAAYSTLGHFADPVLNTMLGWTDAQLAGTLFHELAHQLIYVQDDSAFNEAFASVVEEEGVARWLSRTGELQKLEDWQRQRRRSAEFSELLLAARQRLRTLFASGTPETEMNHRKQQVFGQLKYTYENLRATWGGYAGYDAWFARTLNNADLVSAATYRRCMPGFRRILDSARGDLEQFYIRVRELGAQPALERQRLLCGEGS